MSTQLNRQRPASGALRRPSPAVTRLIAQPRLSPQTLERLPAAVRRPAFRPESLRPGILHLGCGAFHRAHQAVLTQRAIEAEMAGAPGAPPPAWGIVSTSLRTATTVKALARQGGLYSVLERGARGSRVEIVGSVRETIYAPESADTLARYLGDPAIRIVTLTVTPSGYCTDAASGRLDPQHPDVQADLHAAQPRSPIGLVVEGLALRRAAGLAPPVMLSCDNVASNGALLRQAAIDMAALRDDRLAGWIESNVQFPRCMVDRIVPGMTEADREEAAAALGLIDAAPVVAEPFSQWVIERFEGPRPLWEAAGATFVPDVAPWEASKLRLLNGGHLAVACIGSLAGLETVAEAVAQPDIADFALRFMICEQMPTLPPSDHDIRAYAHQLLDRWRNPGIRHLLARVGRDASSKLPARLLASLRDNLQAGRPAPCTTLAVAAWMHGATLAAAGPSSRSRANDCMAERLRQLRPASDAPRDIVAAFVGLHDIFGDDLPACSRWRESLATALGLLRHGGVQAAVAACLRGEFA